MHNRLARVLTAALLVGACDGAAVPPDPAGLAQPRGGARLKVRWVYTSDGRRVARHWSESFYDTELGTSCGFRYAGDGELRCLPSDFLATQTTEYADESCTKEVALGREPCRPPRFLRKVEELNPCTTGQRVFVIGAQVPDGRTYFRSLGTGIERCIGLGAAPGTQAYLLGEEIPPARFVKAVLSTAPPVPGDQLRLITLQAEDGARAPWSWEDAESSRRCALVRFPDRSLRCVPGLGTQGGSYFAEPTCQAPAYFFKPSCGGEPPSFVYKPGRGPACENQVYSRGPALDEVAALQRELCLPTPVPEGWEAFGAGLPIAAEQFAALAEPLLGALGPIYTRLRVPPRGRVSIAEQLFDRRRQEPCDAELVGDTFRCVPLDATASLEYFSDSACTNPIHLGSALSCLPKVVHRIERDTCPARRRYYALADEHAGPAFFLGTFHSSRGDESASGYRCTPVDRSGRPNWMFHNLVALPDDEFAEVRVSDPAE